jgi:hypothetical protein
VRIIILGPLIFNHSQVRWEPIPKSQLILSLNLSLFIIFNFVFIVLLDHAISLV